MWLTLPRESCVFRWRGRLGGGRLAKLHSVVLQLEANSHTEADDAGMMLLYQYGHRLTLRKLAKQSMGTTDSPKHNSPRRGETSVDLMLVQSSGMISQWLQAISVYDVCLFSMYSRPIHPSVAYRLLPLFINVCWINARIALSNQAWAAQWWLHYFACWSLIF